MKAPTTLDRHYIEYVHNWVTSNMSREEYQRMISSFNAAKEECEISQSMSSIDYLLAYGSPKGERPITPDQYLDELLDVDEDSLDEEEKELLHSVMEDKFEFAPFPDIDETCFEDHQKWVEEVVQDYSPTQ